MPTFNDHLPPQNQLQPLLVPADVFNDLLSIVNQLKSQTNQRTSKSSRKIDRVTTVYSRSQALDKGKDIYGRAFYNWMLKKSTSAQMDAWSHITLHGFARAGDDEPDPSEEILVDEENVEGNGKGTQDDTPTDPLDDPPVAVEPAQRKVRRAASKS